MWVMEDKEGILSNSRIISKELIESCYEKVSNAINASVQQKDFYDAFIPFLKNLKTLIDCNTIEHNKYLKSITKGRNILNNINARCTFINNIELKGIIGNLDAFIIACEDGKEYKRRQQAAKGAISLYLRGLTQTTGTANKIHAFMNDYNRIAYSSSFRRLQDKTQVFPLEKHDYARTRLTHSIEVSSIAAQLGNITAIKMFSGNNQVKKNIAFQAEKILSCAALLHDIGNPPFGHFGEDAIKDYFKQNFDNLKILLYPGEEEKYLKELCEETNGELSKTFKCDFTLFDGNAQSFRIAAKTQIYKPGHSLELTGAVLGAIIKYPFDSLYASKNWKKDKFGYFYSEREEFQSLVDMNTAKTNDRNPLVLLLEAADDICYVTSDLDDAIKKRILNYEIFCNELSGQAINNQVIKSFYENFEKYYKDNSIHTDENAFELTMQRMLNDLRIQLIGEVSEAFLNQKKNILKGINVIKIKGENTNSLRKQDESHCYELLKCIKSAPLIEWLKSLFPKYIYKSKNIIKNELTGYEIITYLLQEFVEAVLKLEFNKGEITAESSKKYSKQARIFSLISSNFVQTFKKEVNKLEKENLLEHVYYRLRLVVDYISGMTDSYAKEVYQALKGI